MTDDPKRNLAQDSPQTGTPPSVEGNRGIPLVQVGENKRAKVIDIEGGWGVKKRLSQMGIHPGDLVTVVRYGALGGPMVIEVHGFQLALGRGVASQVFVEETAE
jgi:ferrous iron transport protein A